MPRQTKLIAVTDLDGTLLDDRYQWEPARPALEKLREFGFPLVLNSSKTLAELEPIARELGTRAPLLAENGALTAVPSASPLRQHFIAECQDLGYAWSASGVGRRKILSIIHALRDARGFSFEGFSDWSPSEVAEKTGLPLRSAELACRRLATEPIIWGDSSQRWREFTSLIDSRGLRALEGGRFVHLMGSNDKATAMAQAQGLYESLEPATRWKLVALGDSPNDFDMLSAADIAVVIPTERGPRLKPNAPWVVEADLPGPRGWNQAMTNILREYD